jgi:hypothetical protein
MRELNLPPRTVGSPDVRLNASERSQWPQRALSRWENEGGAGPRSLPESSRLDDRRPDAPALPNFELVQLPVRVIARKTWS